MAAPNSPEFDEQRCNFRAPPPSPVMSGRRSSCVANDEILTGFLEQSLQVPALILPDSVFPKEHRIAAPPLVDLGDRSAAETIAEALSGIGCFQVWISEEIAAMFSLGFEIDDFSEEEFLWSVDQGSFNSLFDRISPIQNSHFRKQMEILLTEIEKIGDTLLSMISLKNPPPTTSTAIDNSNETFSQKNNVVVNRGTLCCLYKNNKTSVGIDGDNDISESLRHDIIRKLVRRDEHSHALCFHICGGSSEFHIYSKKGWFSFCPHKDALVVTIGDQIQTWSGGKYKHVIGRPVFKEDQVDSISMAFLYSPSNINCSKFKLPTTSSEKIISLNQQVILAILSTIIYQFMAYLCQSI